MNLDLCRKLSEILTMVGMKQGLNHTDSIKLRRMVPDDFIVSDPIEAHWLNDLRHGGQVLYGAFHHILYGKKRHLLEEYTADARAGRWDEAFQKWTALTPVRDLADEIMLGPLQKQGFTYATTLGNIKVWYDAMGLTGGYMRSPIRQVSPEYREYITGNVKERGGVRAPLTIEGTVVLLDPDITKRLRTSRPSTKPCAFTCPERYQPMARAYD